MGVRQLCTSGLSWLYEEFGGQEPWGGVTAVPPKPLSGPGLLRLLDEELKTPVY